MALHLVKAKDYNGYKDVMFCMEDTDFRFNTDNYIDCGVLTKVKGERNIYQQVLGVRWFRHQDWSLSVADVVVVH
jgi:hypothetical protein